MFRFNVYDYINMIKKRMELYNKSRTELKSMLWASNVPIARHFKNKEYYIDKYLEAVNSETNSYNYIMSDNKHIHELQYHHKLNHKQTIYTNDKLNQNTAYLSDNQGKIRIKSENKKYVG